MAFSLVYIHHGKALWQLSMRQLATMCQQLGGQETKMLVLGSLRSFYAVQYTRYFFTDMIQASSPRWIQSITAFLRKLSPVSKWTISREL